MRYLIYCPMCDHAEVKTGKRKPRRKVCKNCGEKEVKVISGSELKCYIDGKKFSETDLTIPPSFNLKAKTFYCGCRGWD